jgi:hypothetical protein
VHDAAIQAWADAFRAAAKVGQDLEVEVPFLGPAVDAAYEAGLRVAKVITPELDQEKAHAAVLSLIGAGFNFSQVEDYDLAVEWACRAYIAGHAAGSGAALPTLPPLEIGAQREEGEPNE